MHYIKLILKHIFFINYFGQRFYECIYNTVDEYSIVIVFSSLALIAFVLYRYLFPIRRINNFKALILFFLSCSISLYIPLSFLFFQNWKEIELDRLGYGTMVFGVSMVFLIVWHLKSEFCRHLFYFIFLGLSALLLHEYTTRWQKSGLIRDNFSKNLPVYEHKSVYLVAAPIVFKYAYLITINDTLELHRHLKIFKNSTPNSQYRILGFYNMVDIDDIISVKKINDSSIHCRTEKWGAWCWFNLKSAIKSYENTKYKLVADDDNLGYKVYFKSLDTNSKIILFNKLQFKEIELSKKEDGFIFI